MGDVLLQVYNAGLYPMAYFSKKYILAEINYATHDEELLAVFKAYQKLRCNTDAHPTTYFTDEKPLVSLQMYPHLSKKKVRWLE